MAKAKPKTALPLRLTPVEKFYIEYHSNVKGYSVKQIAEDLGRPVSKVQKYVDELPCEPAKETAPPPAPSLPPIPVAPPGAIAEAMKGKHGTTILTEAAAMMCDRARPGAAKAAQYEVLIKNAVAQQDYALAAKLQQEAESITREDLQQPEVDYIIKPRPNDPSM